MKNGERVFAGLTFLHEAASIADQQDAAAFEALLQSAVLDTRENLHRVTQFITKVDAALARRGK